jgi:hypothetical protein
MSVRFDPRRDLIAVDARFRGPAGLVRAGVLLDTGSAYPVLESGLLSAAGYNLANPRSRIQIATASSTALMPLHMVSEISALGRDRKDVAVLAHTLPIGARVDGLLGVRFFRGLRLTIDFVAATTTLE